MRFRVAPAGSCCRNQLLDFANELCELSGAGFFTHAPVELEPRQRLEIALKLAFEHFESLPAHQRVVNPFEAIAILGSYIASLAAYATYILDGALLWRIPSLMAFGPLTPSILLMEKIVYSVREIRADRADQGLMGLRENVAALEAPDNAGFTPAMRDSTIAHMLNGVGLLEASLGRLGAMECADRIEAVPDHHVNAWRIRYLVHLYRPNAVEAERCWREVESLRLQEGPRQFGEGSTVEAELLAFARSDDMLGLARIKPQIEERAALYPGWVPWLRVAEAELERMRHRLDRAIELHGEALALTSPEDHLAWSHAAAFQLDALVQAGRAAEAKERGRAWLAVAEQHRLYGIAGIATGLALAEAMLGEHDVARERAAREVQKAETVNVFGLYYGVVLEAAARVAVECNDSVAFADYYNRCHEQFGSGAYPPLTARLEKLMTAA